MKLFLSPFVVSLFVLSGFYCLPSQADYGSQQQIQQHQQLQQRQAYEFQKMWDAFTPEQKAAYTKKIAEEQFAKELNEANEKVSLLTSKERGKLTCEEPFLRAAEATALKELREATIRRADVRLDFQMPHSLGRLIEISPWKAKEILVEAASKLPSETLKKTNELTLNLFFNPLSFQTFYNGVRTFYETNVQQENVLSNYVFYYLQEDIIEMPFATFNAWMVSDEQKALVEAALTSRIEFSKSILANLKKLCSAK